LIASVCANGLRSSAQAAALLAGRHRLRVDQRRLRSTSKPDATFSQLYDALPETEPTF
jgi:hypothetical protein